MNEKRERERERQCEREMGGREREREIHTHTGMLLSVHTQEQEKFDWAYYRQMDPIEDTLRRFEALGFFLFEGSLPICSLGNHVKFIAMKYGINKEIGKRFFI